LTGQAILTPMLMVIVMIAGDFLAMALRRTRYTLHKSQTLGASVG